MTKYRALGLTLRWWIASHIVGLAMRVASHDVRLCEDLADAIGAAVPRAEALRDEVLRT